MTHDGEGNFIVIVYPLDTDASEELVTYKFGEYDGQTTFDFNGVGYIDVEADGEWTLQME